MTVKVAVIGRTTTSPNPSPLLRVSSFVVVVRPDVTCLHLCSTLDRGILGPQGRVSGLGGTYCSQVGIGWMEFSRYIPEDESTVDRQHRDYRDNPSNPRLLSRLSSVNQRIRHERIQMANSKKKKPKIVSKAYGGWIFRSGWPQVTIHPPVVFHSESRSWKRRHSIRHGIAPPYRIRGRSIGR